MSFRTVWDSLVRDDICWAERASGIMLVALRGAVLKWGPAVYLPPEVGARLADIGVNEERWGLYLMVCGLLQIWYAGQDRSTMRLLVTIAILLGFVVMVAGFMDTPPGTVNASLICMSGFYLLLLGRVWRDRDSAPPEVGQEDG